MAELGGGDRDCSEYIGASGVAVGGVKSSLGSDCSEDTNDG